MEDRLAWIRQMLETDGEDASDLVRTIKIDLSQEDTFAVTPKGDVINLPAGATVIDFAFAIHSAVGTRMNGAKVDGKIVPINHVVKTGEVIEILTTNAAGHGPSRDWLNIAVTSSAKAKIRSWFKKERRDENIETGRTALETELRRNSIVLPEKEMREFLEEAAKKQKLPNVEELFASIGYGGIHIEKIIPKLKEDYIRLVKSAQKPSIDEYIQKHTVRSPEGVIVEGIDNCLVKISKCCNPVPGDAIIGFITRGKGVSVHRASCVNVREENLDEESKARRIRCTWNHMPHGKYNAELSIECADRKGILADIASVVSDNSINIVSATSHSGKSKIAIITLQVEVTDREQVDLLVKKLYRVPNILDIRS
jgi:GTP pyrophosphokinase